MPRILAIDPRVPTAHGLVIRRHTLAEQTRAHITIKEARAYAKRIVKEAKLEAESLKQEAMRQGFSDGWQDSLTVIYESLQGTKHVHGQIEAALKQSVQDELEKALQQPGMELQLIEGWLALAPPVNATLHLVLPEGAQSDVQTIIRRVEESLQITPTVSITNGKNIVIESGEQVFEFSPTRTMEEMNDLARKCLRRLEVKKQCAVWSVHVVQHWLSTLAQRYDGVLPEVSNDSDDEENSNADLTEDAPVTHVAAAQEEVKPTDAPALSEKTDALHERQESHEPRMPFRPDMLHRPDRPNLPNFGESDESREMLARAREMFKSRQMPKPDKMDEFDFDDLDFFDGLDDFDEDDD